MKIAVDGASLNIEIEGPASADTILLWHGAGCTLRMWDNVVARLADRYQLIRFDVRGVGQSLPAEGQDNQYSLEQYAADANAILAHFNVEQCHIWSMAWGSRAALAYCALFPGKVISAALFDASIGKPDVEQQKQGGKEALLKQIDAGIEAFARPEGWNVHVDPETVPKSLGATARFDLVAAAEKLSMPVLVATGDHDPNLASSHEIVEKAENAYLVVMKNVGHGSVLQRPDLATATLLEFHAQLNI
jgi:3-oxoadipate enol-lactonase